MSGGWVHDGDELSRGWFDRPLHAEDLAVPEAEREAWADEIGAVTMARMQITWPEQQIVGWRRTGSLMVVPASGGVIPVWSLTPLPAQPGDDGPFAPHPVVALVSRAVLQGLVGTAGEQLQGTEDRSRALLGWWHTPHRLLGGDVPPRDVLPFAPPRMMLYMAWHSGGLRRWLPAGLRDL
jgi:hypothetical protein